MWLTRRRLLVLTPACLSGTAAHATYLPSPPGPIALNGFDPVSYFLGEPEPGRATYETAWAGRTWRFARPGNREAFRHDPVRYAPRLGGFDPVGVLAGRLVDTDPAIFARVPDAAGLDQLYLFRNPEHRARLIANPALAEQAERRWPELRSQIERNFPD